MRFSVAKPHETSERREEPRRRALEPLKVRGADVVFTVGVGLDDWYASRAANERQRVVVTFDKDFGEEEGIRSGKKEYVQAIQ